MSRMRPQMLMTTLVLLCIGCGYPRHGYWGSRRTYGPGAYIELSRDTIATADATGAPDIDKYVPKRLTGSRRSPVFHVPPGGGEGPVMSDRDREMFWNGKFRLDQKGHWVSYVVRVTFAIHVAQSETYFFVPGDKRPILIEARIE